MLNKAERTVDNLTDQLCSYERALAGKTEPVKHEALFAKVSNVKLVSVPKFKKSKVKSTKYSSTIVCHYCKQTGHIVRQCQKWIADGKPPKPVNSNAVNSVSLIAVQSDVFIVDKLLCADE